jgi:hypothetical protein
VAINRLNPDYPDAGIVQLIPGSVDIGSGSATVNGNGQISFSGASSISINDIFNSTYTNYKVIGDITNTSASLVSMRYRVSSSDRTSGYLTSSFYLALSAADFLKDNNGTTYSRISYCAANTDTTFESILYRPFTTAKTYQSTIAIRGDAYVYQSGTYTDSTTSYTGFTIYPNSGGTMTGSFSVYGYRN